MAVAISCQSEGALQVYIEPVVPTPHLVDRRPLADGPHAGRSGVGAGLADGLSIDGPDFSAAEVTPAPSSIVATQGHGDEEAIEQAVSAFPAFVGVVASRKRGEALLGTWPTAASRRTCSTGYGCRSGSTSATPRTARSRWRSWPNWCSAAPPASCSRTPSPAHRRRAAEAIDPVCGMTVPADASSRPFEHDGVTYYFCCAGLPRRAFETDPDTAYLTAQEARC